MANTRFNPVKRLNVKREKTAPTVSASKLELAVSSSSLDLVAAKTPLDKKHLLLPKRGKLCGVVYVCGMGETGQLGLGDDVFERKRPTPLKGISEYVVDVKAGGMHTMVLTISGDVYTCGCNDEGALGRQGDEFTPGLVELPGPVVKMSAGDSHSAVLLENGQVYAWGSFRGSSGNMGLTVEGNKRTPVRLMDDIFVDIASGSDHLLLLRQDCHLFSIGCGEQGQLGRVGSRTSLGRGRTGNTSLLQPKEVFGRREFISEIWATSYASFMRVFDKNTILACGLNNYRQLSANSSEDVVYKVQKTNLTDVVEITGGQHHLVVRNSKNQVLTIGRSDYGRLGLGKYRKADYSQLTLVPALSNKDVVAVASGESVSFAITKEGNLYAWGMGGNCQLGLDTEDDVNEPQLVQSKHTAGYAFKKVSSGGQHTVFLLEKLSDAKENNQQVANHAA